jgi:hypothetical protein
MSQINDVDGVMNDHDEDMFSAITSPLASRYAILQRDLEQRNSPCIAHCVRKLIILPVPCLQSKIPG